MIKYLSLFSGIGAPEQALKNIGINYELVGFSEIDKFAIKSYCNVHGVTEELNLGDITQIDISSLPTDIDIITHGSPCQDFSIAGQQKGGDKGTGTRSSLMWNTVEIVEQCRPKVVVWENVKNLLSNKHRHNFDAYLEVMEQLDYSSYYKVLNAKDFGVPQNRERVFTVSIRKDIDEGYVFPEPQELTLRLKDMLEDEVDEKYTISTCKVQQLIKNVDGNLDLEKQIIGTCHKINDTSHHSRENVYNYNKTAPTLSATMYKGAPKILVPIEEEGYTNRSITDVNKLCRCLDTMGGGQREPKILEPLLTETDEGYKVRVANKQGYQMAMEGDGIDLEQPNSKTRRGRVQKQSIGKLNTAPNKAVVDQYRVRKLTPRECWRLMGFKDAQFNKAAEICSNSQLYKQAGNSIVVNVLEEIFKNLSILKR